jgi:hypothetical protein
MNNYELNFIFMNHFYYHFFTRNFIFRGSEVKIIYLTNVEFCGSSFASTITIYETTEFEHYFR